MVSERLEYAMFPRAEMERRYAAARKLMAERGIDCLLITGEENFQYFAGTTASLALHYSLTRPSVLVLPMEREPIILTAIGYNITMGSYVSDVRPFYDILTFPHDLVVEALTDAAPDLRRIGVELGQEQRMGIPVGAYLELVEALSGVEFVDAAEIVISVRMVKAPEEVAYMRQAAEITGRARQRLFDRVVPGMTERDVARLTRQLIMEEGGDRTSFVHLQSDLPGSSNIFSYDRPLQKGTVLAVDTGAYVGMYTVDYARMATLGPTTDEQRRVHAAALEVNQKMMDVLRPGVTCSEVYHVAVRAIEEAGVTVDTPLRLQGSRMGHGQGMLLTEPPSIAAADHTVLQPGMVISTEPGVRSGDVQILWEDVHLITEDGYEKITLETPELREIPF